MIRLPFKLGKKKDSARFLTVDIGSNAVKVMAFEVEETEKGPVASIIGVGKKDLLEESTRGGVIVDTGDVSEALTAAVIDACNGDDDITQAIFGVSGNLSIGLMTTVRVVRGKEVPISEKELDVIFAKTYDAALEQVHNKLLETTGNPSTDVQMITSSVVYTKVDGKAVADPIGIEGQRLELAVFTSFTPTYHLNALQEVVSKANVEIMAVGSTIYSMVKSLTFSKGDDFDGVIMDIGGEVTEVGVVFSGGVVASRSLDIGGNHFTHELSSSMDLTLRDAEHKKLEYSYGRLAESDVLLVQGYMDNLLDIWLHGVELLFQEFVGVKTFAPNIYMVGGGAELPDIYEVTSKEPWTRSIPFKSPPEFSKLSMEDLPLVVDKTGKVHGMEDIGPASLSLVYLELEGLIE
jgi:cell division ATPase FtsA